MNMSKRGKIGFLILLALVSCIVLFSLCKKNSLSVLPNEKEISYIVIGLDQAKERYDENTYIFVDTRKDLLYRLGHIKNAVNFPLAKFDQDIIEFEKKITKNTGIVIYCDGSICSSSYTLANKLNKRGYRKIEVFFGGWKEWVNSSFPIEYRERSIK